ncbi:MAG: DUF4339 domain-containing protein [Deltaproteobacteria bacterium]|nr:DUF4339 domain-containing protein [Deltaproteobacteria bacterium]MBN2672885.1 DUF4339 domain-containing protein [Deltaproteobacteria bacterium]
MVRQWKQFICVVMAASLLGCGPAIRQMSMTEGQENLNIQEAQDGPVTPPVEGSSPLGDSITVTLAVPDNMGCVLLKDTPEDEAMGHKSGACPLAPIPGQDIPSELKNMYENEPNHNRNAKLTFALIDIGGVIQSELERSLKKHYQHVTVNRVSVDETTANIQISDMIIYPIWGGTESTVTITSGTSAGTGETSMRPPGKHAAWFFPLMILSIPAFVWAPMLGIQRVQDVNRAKAVVAAIRAATDQLALQIVKNGGVAPNSSTTIMAPAPAEPVAAQVTPTPTAEPKIWQVVQNDQATGPFSVADVASMVNAGSILPETLMWKEGMSNWLPCEQIEDISCVAAPKIWNVVQDGKNSGPYSAQEVSEMIQQKRIVPETLMWKEGMQNWQPCSQIGEFTCADEPKIWRYVQDGKSVGTFTTTEMLSKIQHGVVTGDTHVWKEGMDAWTPCRAVEPFASAIAKTTP